MTSLAAKPAISLSRIAIYAVLILAVLLYLVPLVVMLLTSGWALIGPSPSARPRSSTSRT